MQKIRLRALEPEDLDMLYEIENDRSLWNVGATNVPYSRYTLHDYIAHSRDDIYSDRQVRLIVENTDGEAVGIADVVNFDPQHMRAELWASSSSRHTGIKDMPVLSLKRCYITLFMCYICIRCM